MVLFHTVINPFDRFIRRGRILGYKVKKVEINPFNIHHTFGGSDFEREPIFYTVTYFVAPVDMTFSSHSITKSYHSHRYKLGKQSMIRMLQGISL